jgi:hypothetical protein
MQVSESFKETFNKLLKELAKTYKEFGEDPNRYFQEIHKQNLIARLIDAPDNLKAEMREKWESQEPCIFQLHHTALSLELTRELAELFKKQNQLNCLSSELESIIEAVVYEFANTHRDDFIDIIINSEAGQSIDVESLKNIIKCRVANFKQGFAGFTFQFPVKIFNLQNELQLSKSIRLIPVDSIDLTETELSHFKDTRTFDSNYYLEIRLEALCSKELAFKQAEKAKDVTYNILKLLATRLSTRAIPLLESNARSQHPLDFYKYGHDSDSMSTVTTIKFPSFQSHSKEFWEVFNKSRTVEKNLIDIALQIPEILLVPNFSRPKVVDRLERSLLWYGDAATEPNSYQKIQKLVSSLEALVNFRDPKVTEAFIRRVTNLNITHDGLSSIIRDQARQLYDARSKIIHGSSIDERLGFCAIDFCSGTLLGAIYYLSLFGFEKKGFNNTLPKFLDDLPTLAEFRSD